MWARNRIGVLISSVLLVSSACGGSAAEVSGPDVTEGPEPTASPGNGIQPTSPAGGPTARLRVANLWMEANGPGPSVVLNVFGTEEEGGPPLLEVAPEAVSDYVEVPPARFGDSVATLQVYRADDVGGSSIFLDFAPGDVVTAIVHGAESDGEIQLSLTRFWEVGDPQTGLPWPEVSADQATLVIYPGALLTLPLELHAWYYASVDGECLIDAQTGEASEGGFGGNISQFYLLEAGTTEIAATPGPCDAAPAFGPAIIEAGAGDRIGLFPYGTGADDLRMLTLSLSGE